MAAGNVETLISAVESGEVGLVDAVLVSSSEPAVLINKMTPLSPQMSALMVACMGGQKHMIKHLIAKGADVDLMTPDYPYCTALIKAVQAGKLNIVKLLVEKYHVQVGLLKGKSALMTACEFENVEIVEYLLSCLVSKDDTNDKTESLSTAIQQGHSELVTLLLRAGAQVIQSGTYSLLTKACRCKSSGVVEAILDESTAEVNFVPEHGGESALMVASSRGCREIVELLLESGADVNLESTTGEFPLLCAVKKQHAEVVRLLLDRGAHVNKRSKEEVTSLMQATGGRNVPAKLPIVRMLLGCSNVDLDAYSEMGNVGHSALQDAIISDSLKTVTLLLEHGADVDLVVKMTPLQLAVKCRREEIAKLLLNKGAEVDLKDQSGTTALISAMYPLSSMIVVENPPSSKDMVELLLNFNAKPNLQDHKRHSALFHAAKLHCYDCCDVLLRRGADPKLTGYDGESPERMLKREYASRIRGPPEDLIKIVEKLCEHNQKFRPKRFCRDGDHRTYPVSLLSRLQQSPPLELVASSHQQQNTQSVTLIKSEDVNFLIRHLHQHSSKWKDIGASLDFSYGELENIRQSFPRDPVHQLLMVMLNQWSQWPTDSHRSSPTLEKLCEGLRSGLVGLGALANQLQQSKDLLPSRQHPDNIPPM